MWNLFERRLGMFVHWGVYSVGGVHEQEWMRCGMSKAEYEKYAERFAGERFDPDAWIDAAVLRIGDRRVVLFDGGPEGTVTRVKGGKSAFGNHTCGATAYEYSFAPADFGFGPGDEIPFNVRVYENDGEGPDGWIEWRPLDEPSPARIVGAGPR